MPSAIADGLRRRGIDVTMPGDVGLIGAGDEAHIAFAVAQLRVIFTHDDDFLAIAKSQAEHCGIVYCHQQARTIGQILGGLLPPVFTAPLKSSGRRNSTGVGLVL